jgi:hypothetical protein
MFLFQFIYDHPNNEGKWTLQELPQNSPFGEILGWKYCMCEFFVKSKNNLKISGPRRVTWRVVINQSFRGRPRVVLKGLFKG